MFKRFILVILLHTLLTKETESKEDIVQLSEWYESTTLFDDAIVNYTQRPTRSKLFFASPPVSQEELRIFEVFHKVIG
jgi:hypothetical protein